MSNTATIESLESRMVEHGLLPQPDESMPLTVSRELRASKKPEDLELAEWITRNRRIRISELRARGNTVDQIAEELDISRGTVINDLKQVREENLVQLGSLKIESILHSYQQGLASIDRETWKQYEQIKDPYLKRKYLHDLRQSQNEQAKIMGQIMKDLGVFPGESKTFNVNVNHSTEANVNSKIEDMPEDEFMRLFAGRLQNHMDDLNGKVGGEDGTKETQQGTSTTAEGEAPQETMGPKKKKVPIRQLLRKRRRAKKPEFDFPF